MKKLLVLFFLISPAFIILNAQNATIAKLKFGEAEEAYANGKYKEAVQKILEVENILGDPNEKTTHLKILSYDKLLMLNPTGNDEAIKGIKIMCQQYLKDYEDTPNLDKYKEIYNISSPLESEEAEFKNVQEKQTIENCTAFLSKRSYGLYIDDVSWIKASTISTSAALYEYLDAYPDGKYAAKCKKILTTWENTALEKAFASKEPYALQNFLNNYPRTKYRSDVLAAIEERKQNSEIDAALSSNNNSALRRCLNAYPTNAKIKTVAARLESNAFQDAETTFRNSNWEYAKSKYQSYLSDFPAGSFRDDAQEKIRICEGQIAREQAAYQTKKFFSNVASFLLPVAGGVGFYLLLKAII